MMRKNNNILTEPDRLVKFEKHQPERRRGLKGRLLCNGGCCCCSCCLHSLGGVIGAAVAGNEDPSSSESTTVRCYWTVLAVLTVLLCIIVVCAGGGLAAIIGGALFWLPVVQLVASLVTAFWISGKQVSYAMLGRITLCSFLGAITGLLVMVFFAALLK